jgi:Acyltransferase family
LQEELPTPQQDHSAPLRTRFRMLDYARGIALLLMLVSHSLELFPGNLDGNEWQLISVMLLFTKAATPLFVFVFGMTMAFVYYDQLLTGEGFVHLKKRMRRRAVLAFLSFELIVIVVETANRTSVADTVRRMVYLRPGNWAEVLNFYFVILLVGPWLIRWWRSASPWLRTLTIPALYVLGMLLGQIQVPENLFVIKNIIAGYPHSEIRTAPLDTFPVLQLSSFYLVGLSLGEFLFKELKVNQWRRPFTILGPIIPVGFFASYLISADSIRDYLRKMALDQYRFPPELVYILFGLSSVVTISLVCLYQLQIRQSNSFVVRAIEMIGRHSLFTFNVQYVLLFSVCGLSFDMLHKQSFLLSLTNTVIVILACGGIAWFWERNRTARRSAVRSAIS